MVSEKQQGYQNVIHAINLASEPVENLVKFFRDLEKAHIECKEKGSYVQFMEVFEKLTPKMYYDIGRSEAYRETLKSTVNTFISIKNGNKSGEAKEGQ